MCGVGGNVCKTPFMLFKETKSKKWTLTMFYEKCCILEDMRNRCCYSYSINEGPEDLRITKPSSIVTPELVL